MIHEYALRKVEFYLHNFCLDKNVKAIVDNLLVAADRGYSMGSYMVKGHFVVAPVEDSMSRIVNAQEELLWPFTTESQAKHFLFHVKNYFDLRGARVEIFGVEGFVAR